jgi:pyruvate/2-oxoglutarate dehydrogenase complex dihydrolipoamide dehydrogenase (E3) component
MPGTEALLWETGEALQKLKYHTWSGCVPSKALLAAAEDLCADEGSDKQETFSRAIARVHHARTQVYEAESPEVLRKKGIEVFHGAARFLDQQTVEAGDQRLTARKLPHHPLQAFSEGDY